MHAYRRTDGQSGNKMLLYQFYMREIEALHLIHLTWKLPVHISFVLLIIKEQFLQH